MGIIWALIAGGIAGWLAGKVTKGSGFGAVKNIVLGIIGGFVGGFALGLLQLSPTGFIGDIVAATTGAVLFIFCLRYLAR